MEFLGGIADAGQKDGVINIATGLFQPIAADDVAAIVADAALAAPRNGTIEIAGPERAPFDEIVRSYLRMMGDDRPVHADPGARYFGGRVERLSLVPTGEAQLGRIKLGRLGRDESSRRELNRTSRLVKSEKAMKTTMSALAALAL